MSETCRLRRGEGYGACADEVPRTVSNAKAFALFESRIIQKQAHKKVHLLFYGGDGEIRTRGGSLPN